MNARIALVLVALLSGIRTSSAEPCAPHAVLGGDLEAVTGVTAELVRLGVVVSDEHAARVSGCAMVVAVVEVDRGGGIAVAVRDPMLRSEGRVVSDATLAAAWIDSWLRDDFDPGVAPPAASTPVAVTPTVVRPVETVAPATSTPATSALDQVSFAAAVEQAWADGSRWSGIALAGCVHAGGACIGGRARYATQDVIAKQTAATRSDMSLLVTASASQNLGRMTVAPELGIGAGRLSTARVDGCKAACDPADLMCGTMGMDPPPVCSDPSIGTTLSVGDGFRTTTWTPRASAALRIAIPLFDHVWLDGSAAITVAPFGHADPYLPAMGTAPGIAPDQIALPGDPFAIFQLGVGLRVGAP